MDKVSVGIQHFVQHSNHFIFHSEINKIPYFSFTAGAPVPIFDATDAELKELNPESGRDFAEYMQAVALRDFGQPFQFSEEQARDLMLTVSTIIIPLQPHNWLFFNHFNHAIN